MARWDYQIGVAEDEATERRELESKVAGWWSAFSDKRHEIDDLFNRRAKWDLPEWMAETLQSIDDELMWEFGGAIRTEGHRLVITPEVRRDLRPLVRYVLRQAPQLEGWEFYAHRLPEPLDMARETVEARCGRPSELREVAISVGDHNRIDLRFSGPSVEQDEDFARSEAFVLTETLLGEEVLDCWIGEISVHARPKRGFLRLMARPRPEPDSVPLEEMREKVELAIASIRAGLVDVVTASERDRWALLKMKPEKRDDYPGQSDLFVTKTPSVPLWQATRADGFYDARFGGLGEKFAYVKLDGSEGLDEEKFAAKSEIEDALDELLKPAGWGCQIGGGTGWRYSYIELALKDCGSALPAIREMLAAGNVPRRSWILFHNCEQETEWIGIYDDSPPPP